MASFSIGKGNRAEISNIPLVDGQVLLEVSEDSNDGYMYLDTIDNTNNQLKRVLMGSKNETPPTPTVQYTILYYGNGATGGSTPPQIKDVDESITLYSNGFTKTDYTFVEWNTRSDGSGVSYNEGDTYNINANLDLYAIWERTQPAPEDYIIVAFHNNIGNYDIESPYYFDDTLANGVGMDVGSEITYGKVLAYPCYGAITTNYYVDGGGSSLRTFGFYVSKDPDGVENTDSVHSSDVPYRGSFTITNNITGETERWYVSANIYTIEGDYSSVSVPYFDSSNLINEVDGTEGLKALGEAFLYAIGQDDRGGFDIIGLSDVPFQSIIGDNIQQTINYGGHTYYFYNRLNRDYNDYISYDFNLYTNNTYIKRDDLSRGELAYIIFDGDDIENEGFTHDTDQYITGIFNQPIWVTKDAVYFRDYSADDWQTVSRDYDDVTLSYKDFTSPVYIVFIQNTTSVGVWQGYYIISENSFTPHIHRERYHAGASIPWAVQDYDASTPHTVTKNGITYYASQIYNGSTVVANTHIDGCSLKYTTVTGVSSWGSDQEWELAYIVFDNNYSGNISFTHSVDQYITGIFNQPIWGKENNTFFRYHLRSDWQTEESNYDDITLSYKNFTSPVYIIFLQSTTSIKGFNGYYMVSENSFVGHVHKERYFADGSSYGVQDWDSNPYTVTRNNITYYVSDIYQGSNITLNEYVTNCDLKYTPTTTIQGQNWSDDQRWELAYIVLDGVRSSSIDYATHVKDSYITGIWNEPIPINHYTPTNLNLQNTNNLNSRSLRSDNRNSIITQLPIRDSGTNIQIYNSSRDSWLDMYPLIAKSDTVNVTSGVAPTFTFNVLDIMYPQKMEIFTSVYGIKPENITYTTVGDNVFNTMTITFPIFDTTIYGDISTFTCKIYFYSVGQSLDDEDSWVRMSTLPYNFYNGSAVEYNGRLHIMGGDSGGQTCHYSWDGISWREESTLPINSIDSGVIVYDGKIHLLGSASNDALNAHYSWDGSSWTQETNVPIYFFGKDRVVLYQGNLCTVTSGFGSYSQFRYIEAWDGTTWTQLALTPAANVYGQAEYLSGYIHMISASGDGVSCMKWDGTDFTADVTIPTTSISGTSTVFGNKIHIIGGGNQRQHLTFDGIQWTALNNLNYDLYKGAAVVYNGRIHLIGGNNSSTTSKNHYMWKGL